LKECNKYDELKAEMEAIQKQMVEAKKNERANALKEVKRLSKLEAIADKLKLGENVQNRQLQAWLSEEEYEQLEYEWKEQLELREELKILSLMNSLETHKA
jgi:seryl-tRNA synthetase